MSKTWNTAYENDIDDNTAGSLIDDNIRTLKSEIRKRMETFFDNWENDPDAPSTLEVAKGDNLFLGVPVGSVIAFVDGYFTNDSNGGFTQVSITLGDRWRLCDGSEINDSESPIFNGSGRHLPNITDYRFIMGSTSSGTAGGSSNSTNLTGITQPVFSSPTHTHTNAGYAKLAISNNSGNGGLFAYANGGGYWTATDRLIIGGASSSWDHPTSSYTFSVALGGSTGGKAVTINRDTDVAVNLPNYLMCKYIMRIK